MPYGPHTEATGQRMLGALGVASVDDLFSDIPAAPRIGIDLPDRSPSSSWRLSPGAGGHE